jgi:phage gp36-like protein
MTYASRNDLEAAFTASEVAALESQGRDIASALSAADQEIDSYLAVRYAVPVSPVPEHVVTIACDIARFRLFSSNSEGEPADRYKAAIIWLKDVSAGRALLPGVALAAGEGAAVPGQSPARSGQANSNFDWCDY